jgi:hypothetical protein
MVVEEQTIVRFAVGVVFVLGDFGRHPAEIDNSLMIIVHMIRLYI